MLPGIDGYEVCRAMRGAGYQAGVIMNWRLVWTHCTAAYPVRRSPRMT